MQVRALSWNLFHGRDKPPDPALFPWRSRLLRIPARNETHVQVNRSLLAEFTARLSVAKWDVALLQETPPRFAAALGAGCAAEHHRVLTSRNSLAPLRRAAAFLNPDLIASGEGGSNLTLVRPAGSLGSITERRDLTIHSGRPERRAMAFTRTGSGVCIANLHATNDVPALAVEDVRLAAESAVEWSGGAPLIFGGDLNLRPAENPEIFDELEERFGLHRFTLPRAIDHILVQKMRIEKRPHQWTPEARDVPFGDRMIRLSDHSPVEALFTSG